MNLGRTPNNLTTLSGRAVLFVTALQDTGSQWTFLILIPGPTVVVSIKTSAALFELHLYKIHLNSGHKVCIHKQKPLCRAWPKCCPLTCQF